MRERPEVVACQHPNRKHFSYVHYGATMGSQQQWTIFKRRARIYSFEVVYNYNTAYVVQYSNVGRYFNDVHDNQTSKWRFNIKTVAQQL